MLIGIISDTHSNHGRLKIARPHLEKMDIVIHCGDWTSPDMIQHFKGMTCHGVFGNCDFGHERFRGGPVTFHEPYLLLTVDGIRIGACHGDDPILIHELLDKEIDLLLSGHTHRASMQKRGYAHHINPGSLAKPKDGTASYAVFDTNKKEGKIFRL